jgi:hypothetical protein
MSQNRLAIAMPQICFNAINRMYCNLIAFQGIYFVDRSSAVFVGERMLLDFARRLLAHPCVLFPC